MTKKPVDNTPEGLIINHPELVKSGQRLTALGVTLFFWAALLYLWQPLLSLLAWGLNIKLFYNHMIVLGGYHSFLNLLAFYATVIAILGGGLILWARINLWRFRGKERRRAPSHTDLARLSQAFGVDADLVVAAQDSRRVQVLLSEQGQVVEIKSVNVSSSNTGSA